MEKEKPVILFPGSKNALVFGIVLIGMLAMFSFALSAAAMKLKVQEKVYVNLSNEMEEKNAEVVKAANYEID